MNSEPGAGTTLRISYLIHLREFNQDFSEHSAVKEAV